MGVRFTGPEEQGDAFGIAVGPIKGHKTLCALEECGWEVYPIESCAVVMYPIRVVIQRLTHIVLEGWFCLTKRQNGIGELILLKQVGELRALIWLVGWGSVGVPV